MSYDYRKKCTFVPMSSKGRVKYKKKAKTNIITNKSQILKDIKGPITFLGDRCEPGGNDYPIVEKIKDKHTVYNVKNWEHTYEILNKI